MACSKMAPPRELSDVTFTKEEAWDRFIMVVKPEQSGKTFVTKQTKERISTDVYLPDVEEPYVELS